MMTSSALRAALCAAIVTGTVPLGAQLSPVPPSSSWRDELRGIGTTARVLIIGAHPDDEDNALIAWLSLGRHVETAYLSLTRGENGVNLNYREGQTLLGMVRTAEILAERKRDGAHQYFTRAYDFGRAKNDSAVYAAWPREPLIDDVVSVIRAFRPQVVISVFAGDTTDREPQHQVAGAVARTAFMLAADTIRVPPARTSRLGAWRVGAFYQLVDSGVAPSLRINVGEVDAERGQSYAEIGADIRLLQRTQPRLPAPRVGPVYRYLRRDSVRAESDHQGNAQMASPSLFADADTAWSRFASLSLADSVRSAIDSVIALTHAPMTGSLPSARDDLSRRLERIVRVSTRARNALGCGGVAAVGCRDALGDLALSLAAVRDRATRALLDANEVVVDVTADREVVAAGDSVGIRAQVYNGGRTPVSVTRVSVEGAGTIGFATSDSAVVPPDSVSRWNGVVRMRVVTYPWWSRAGLIPATWMYDIKPSPGSVVREQLIAGEDRIVSTSAFVTLRIGETELTTKVGPIVARGESTLRGDERRPVVGVPRLSILLERGREYAAAGVPFERLYRVWVGSSIDHADTVTVAMDLPPGLKADSATRTIVLPSFGTRTVFFRVRGRWPMGEYPIQVSVTERADGLVTVQQSGAKVAGRAPPRINPGLVTINTGLLSFEYPHIATQRYPRRASDSVQVVDLRLPPKLRVAVVKGSHDDELESRLVELGVPAYPVDVAMLGIADLSFYSTILIAPRAYAEVEALLPNAAAVRRFAERGGTVVVLYGRDELLAPGVLPYPIAFAAPNAITALEPRTAFRILSPRSSLLDWPNRITQADFADWFGPRARELPATFDVHYRPVIEIDDDNDHSTAAAILATRVGRGTFIYAALSLDEQLVATNPGAARLLVNLLSASLARP